MSVSLLVIYRIDIRYALVESRWGWYTMAHR